MNFTPQYIVEQLTRFPNRSVSSPSKEDIFQTLKSFIKDDQVRIVKQQFRSPYHYIQILYWLMGGMIVALWLAEIMPLLSAVLAGLLFWSGFRYFDWRSSLLTSLPPFTDCFNFIGTKKVENPRVKIVLMAHWDTAPITIPYRHEMVKNLRSTIFIGQFVLFLCVLTCMLPLWQKDLDVFHGGQWVLTAYLVIQLLIVSMDYWRFGYSNGANDNATGCAVALSVAQQLWKKTDLDAEVEICITGAEEVGMLGAKYYYDRFETDLPLFVINFDTVGCEHLQIMTATGSFSKISYEHELMQIARTSANQLKIPVSFEPYHTADVDTVWFARSGVQALTFISKNDEGLPAHIHRPEDTIDKLHWESIQQTIDLAYHISQQIITERVPHE